MFLRWRPADLQAPAFLGFTLVVGALALLPLYLVEHAGGDRVTWDMPTLATVAYVAVFASAPVSCSTNNVSLRTPPTRCCKARSRANSRPIRSGCN
ncbi:MAG: hypothetical protein QNJ91_10765, partial [Gammaproteobacteria bacterium]|nr:hypothetical protein [Gammaproteobacteria bacterium]